MAHSKKTADGDGITLGSEVPYLLYARNRDTGVVARIKMRNSGGYQVRASALADDGTTWTSTSWVNITDAGHLLETDWQAATSAGANNGVLTLWIDGTQKQTITNLDNDTRMVDYVRWGGVNGIDSGTRGTYYMDAFESRRGTYIGTAALLMPQVAGTTPEEAGEDVTLAAASVEANSGGGRVLFSLVPRRAESEGGLETTTVDYTYDPLGRLTRVDYSDGTYFQYAYDAVGNRLSETTPHGTTVYVYDDSNRLVSVGGVSYTWDDNGNLLSDGVYTYTYTFANRLKTVSGPGLTASYEYNGLGDRVSQTVNSVTTDFALDLAGGLTQVLEDGTSAYLYGNERIAEYDENGTEYYLPDALGSVRQLADEDGELVLSQRYEAYGEVLSSQGTGESRYGFTGEWQQDGLVFLRARFYIPAQGRFLSRDMWEGDANVPMSYNAWLYGYANPNSSIDPSGYVPCELLPGEDKPQKCVKYSPNPIVQFEDSMDEMGRQPKPWSEVEKYWVSQAVTLVARRLAYTIQRVAIEQFWKMTGDCNLQEAARLFPIRQVDYRTAFREVYGGPITFKRVGYRCDGECWGESLSARMIRIYQNAEVVGNPTFPIHELGHSFEWALSDILDYKAPRNTLAAVQTANPDFPNRVAVDDVKQKKWGFATSFGSGFNTMQQSYDESPGEEFADMFLGWVYDRWEISEDNSITTAGRARQGFMNQYMPGWVWTAYER